MSIEEYKGGPLYYKDNYFNSEEELHEYYEGDDVYPIEAELCDSRKIGYDLNVDSIVEDLETKILAGCDPEHEWEVEGLDELHAAIERFKSCQTDEVLVTNGKFVRLERPEVPDK